VVTISVNPRMKKMLCFLVIGGMVLSVWACATDKKSQKSDAPVAVPGLSTATSVIGQVITPASVRDTVDSLESALIAIRLSNTSLLHTPLSENCQWPAQMNNAPSSDTLLKMGVSGALASQGKSAAFEGDPRTGLPRPTSPLYLLLKEKETVLRRAKPPRRNGHRNALRAFGVVSLNNKEVEELERELVAYERGAKKCQGLIGTTAKTFQRGIKEKYCENKALKIVKLDGQWESKKAERDDARKQFAPLAKNVLRVTLANLDYLGVALTQMTGVIWKMSSAIKNAKKEFQKLSPREVAMMVSRLENIKKIAPYFPRYMSDQIKIYKDIYSVLKEDYDDLLDEDEKKVAQRILDRVETAELAYAGIREEIAALAVSEDEVFSNTELFTGDSLAAFESPEDRPAKKSKPICGTSRSLPMEHKGI
jgi:predicted transcriptional regulator